MAYYNKDYHTLEQVADRLNIQGTPMVKRRDVRRLIEKYNISFVRVTDRTWWVEEQDLYELEKACKADPGDGKETHLYRHYDKDEKLLYVGISAHAFVRLCGHKKSKWYKKIATVKIETFPSRTLALRAEKSIIQNEKPRYNKAHKVKV
jgi:hypothetical protein